MYLLIDALQFRASMDYLTYYKRLEYLYKAIEKGWIKTPKQICERFECCDKTARNMINRLRESGYLISYCKKSKEYFTEKL